MEPITDLNGKNIVVNNDIDTRFTIKMTLSQFEDLEDELVRVGALVERMNQINQRVKENFEKMWDICCKAYLKDNNYGKE